MKPRDLFDPSTQTAIDQAADHAENVHEGWKDRAYNLVVQYFTIHPNARVPATAIASWAYTKGLEEPPHNRAWGGIMQRASRSGVIARAGADYVEYKAANSHPTIAAFWRKGELS